MRRRRRLPHLVVCVAAVIIGSTTSLALAGAHLDPKALVLRPSDVPQGFGFVPAESRYWPNTALTGTAASPVLARSHRLNGYQGAYQKRDGARLHEILTRADVFRAPSGAEIFFTWFDRDQRNSNADRIRKGAQPYIGRRADLGQGGWIYVQQVPPDYVLVFWRYHRVFAWIRTWGVGVKPTLGLAKRQQRRIVTAS